MRKLLNLLRLLVTIIGLLSGGCAVDVSATRAADKFELHLKPTPTRADSTVATNENAR